MYSSEPFEPVDGVSNEKSAIADMKINRRARRALISCARRGVSELKTFVLVSNARWQRGNER